MHFLRLSYLVIFPLSLVFYAPYAWCEKPIRGAELLQVGMDQSEVLKILGAPRDQIEQEVKRRVIWSYAGVELVFVDGRLIDSMSAAREASVSQIKKAPLSSDKPSRGNELLGILHEISKSSSAAGGPDASIMPMFDPQSARHSSVPSPTTVFPLNLPPGMVQPIQEPE